MPSLLVIDDEPNILTSLAAALGREGFQVDTARTLDAGRARLREAVDFVLLDVGFPDGNGLDLLAEIAADAPDTVVVMMSGQATVDIAVRATKLGAFDVLEKPVELERLLLLLRNAATARALKSENDRLRQPWARPIVGDSPAVRALIDQIRLAGPTSARVLIRGENGTGKELVARALHAASPRASGPFVAVNCSAIPEDLIESELFGHEKGAFTGATQSRRGRFEEAHGGTLFLDEVGDLSLRAQTKLLRVLQESELTRVGGSRTVRVDVRVVSATHRDLEAAVADGSFREDLWFRLNVIPIVVPPLRERAEDVPRLIERFVADLSRELASKPRPFTAAALNLLRRHAFPGNVRELRNLVERLLIMNPGVAIDVAQVSAALPAAAAVSHDRLADAVHDFERRHVQAALEAEGSNMTRAAARLGLERSHLYKKLKQLGLGSGD